MEESAQQTSGAAAEGLLKGVELAATGIEILAVVIIVVVIAAATVRYLSRILSRRVEETTYKEYRHQVARALLLGLEILVAADVIRTVALEPTLQSVMILGLLVVIRTFLGWSLVVEIEQRWPWQPEKAEGAGGGPAEGGTQSDREVEQKV